MTYEWLIANAPSEEDRRIIAGIRDDEMRHYQMFRRLYTELTGQAPPEVMQEPFMPPGSYCEGLQQAVLGEQGAVQRYRQILYAMQSRVHINVVTDILTDELRHGILYNYLYSRNNCQA
jgi:rubrerythrin